MKRADARVKLTMFILKSLCDRTQVYNSIIYVGWTVEIIKNRNMSIYYHITYNGVDINGYMVIAWIVPSHQKTKLARKS